MDWRSKCAVIIPCFNEEQSIASVVNAVRLVVPTVMVVDDGSTDTTSAKAQTSGAEVLRFEKSRGKGAALRAGWLATRNRGFEFALSMDGDGQHSPEDIPKFFRCAETTGADLVVGDRMGDAVQMPFVRRFVNRWMSRRLSALARMHLPDSQCGFRLMNLSAWHSLSTSASHFEIESEVLLSFARAKKKIEFVPIRVIYRNEQSKISPVRDTVRWFRWLARVK